MFLKKVLTYAMFSQNDKNNPLKKIRFKNTIFILVFHDLVGNGKYTSIFVKMYIPESGQLEV